MIKTRKIGLGICMVVLGAVMMAVPVSAESSDSDYYTLELDSYTQKGYRCPNRYMEGQLSEVTNRCAISKSDAKYYDAAIRKKAEDYLSRGYLVCDLRNLTEFGVVILEKDNDYVFNNGIVTYDEDQYRIDCKCSYKDYKDFYNHIKNSYKLKKVRDYTFDTSSNYSDYIRIKYDKSTEVLTYYLEFLEY